MILKVNCELEGSKGTVCRTTSSSPSFDIAGDDRSISTNGWCAALGSIGFLETAYLTYLKLTDSDVFCPVGEGSRNTILTSDLSIFGILS